MTWLECHPARDAQALAARLQASLETGHGVVQDATERPRERPQDPELQRHFDSGKCHPHTDKNLLLGELPTRQVLYLSPTVEGKKQDKKLAGEVALSYPVGTVLHQDTGFQGRVVRGNRLCCDLDFLKRLGTLAGGLDAFGYEVGLQTLEIALHSIIYFARDYGLPRNLPGRTGWFNKLRFGLIEYDRLIYLSQYND